MLIEINEDIGIKTIKDFYLQLKDAIAVHDELILDFNKVKRIDLSFVQVLIAANKEYQKLYNKRIILKSISGDVKNQLYIAGFAKS